MDRLHSCRRNYHYLRLNANGGVRGPIMSMRRLVLGTVISAALGLVYYLTQMSLFGIVEVPGWSFNTSRNLSSYIHPVHHTTILSPAEACRSPPYLLVVICSAVGNREARMAIRNTWANTSNLNTLSEDNVRVVFLLGQNNDDTLDSSLIEESLQYSDIIQDKFHDTYNNLTLKSVAMLKWAIANCQEAKYLMKSDDDVLVNIPTLLRTLKARPQVTETLFGLLNSNSRPKSDPRKKWYMPKYLFSERFYPDYLSGSGYVMSLDVASKLYETAWSMPLIHMEDVYITGVCARQAKLRPMNHPGFIHDPEELNVCNVEILISVHEFTPSSLYTIWNKLKDSKGTTCPND